MASNILRNLDRLAGVAGNVFIGERARKEALLKAHLARSQERAMQREKYDLDLQNRMKVQTAADKASLERVGIEESGKTKREEMGIEAGKYDKGGRWSYLTRSLKLDPKFAAVYDITESRLGDIDDMFSGPSAIFLTDQQKRNLQNERIYYNLLISELNTKIIPKIQDRVFGKLHEKGIDDIFGSPYDNKKIPPPKGTSSDESIYGEYEQYKR